MRVLIVEDEKELAYGLSVILKQNNYKTEVRDNGEDALESIMTTEYDIVILDVMLPGMSGLEMLEYMRKESVHTPVILLTAKSEVEDKVTGLDCGADDYMTKPFDAEELMARIRVRTRNPQSADKDMMKLGNTSLNRGKRELECGNHSIKLGRKEYELMEYLMINAGHIMTKDMLIARVWDPFDEPEYNHLEVYISFLRKKLKHIQSDISIVTTRNVGYSLEEDSWSED